MKFQIEYDTVSFFPSPWRNSACEIFIIGRKRGVKVGPGCIINKGRVEGVQRRNIKDRVG